MEDTVVPIAIGVGLQRDSKFQSPSLD
jgi:hypothetical protein